MKVICLSMWVLGGAAGVVAVLFFAVAILGHLGVLADVGDQENRQMGRQALWIGLVAGGPSIVLLLIAKILQRSK